MTSYKTILWLAVLLLASAPLSLAQGTYTQIDYPGSTVSQCGGINNAGDIVGEYLGGNGAYYSGFLLSNGAYTTIQGGVSGSTFLYGINDVGQVVGSSSEGFVYNLQTQTFTTVKYPNSKTSNPSSINNAGIVAGSYLYLSVFSGFKMVNGIYQKINPGAKYTFVTGISGSGKLAVDIQNNPTANFDIFLYFQGKYRKLPMLNAPGANVQGINEAGNAIVGVYTPSSGVNAGFVYQNGTLTTLQFPGSNVTWATGINDTGAVVGYFSSLTGGFHCFLWTPPAPAEKK